MKNIISHNILPALTNAFISSTQAIICKYEKHVSYLQFAYKFYSFIDPAVMFVAEPRPLPPELLALTPDGLQAIGEYHTLSSPGSTTRSVYLGTPEQERPPAQKFWLTNKAKYPALACIAEKLFALRAGIAGVERQFKLLRTIQTPQRNRMSKETLEGIFLMCANAHITDVFKRNALLE
jgi:hypothetical protein